MGQGFRSTSYNTLLRWHLQLHSVWAGIFITSYCYNGQRLYHLYLQLVTDIWRIQQPFPFHLPVHNVHAHMRIRLHAHPIIDALNPCVSTRDTCPTYETNYWYLKVSGKPSLVDSASVASRVLVNCLWISDFVWWSWPSDTALSYGTASTLTDVSSL